MTDTAKKRLSVDRRQKCIFTVGIMPCQIWQPKTELQLVGVRLCHAQPRGYQALKARLCGCAWDKPKPISVSDWKYIHSTKPVKPAPPDFLHPKYQYCTNCWKVWAGQCMN